MSTKVLIHKPTNEELVTRREKLDVILTEHKEKKESPADKELIKEMKAVYSGYDRHMLHKDRLYIMANDSFVSEMSIFRYSHTIRTMFEDIEEIQAVAKTNYDNEKGFVRINALKIGLESIKLKEDILSGKAMDVSIELLGKKMRKLTEENNQLTGKLTKSID